MKNLLISVITSEKTWINFSKFGFDKQITKLRNEFDFSVVLNGNNNEAVNYYNNFKPEYFFLRPNLGFDAAAIAYLINLLPDYNYYLIMHDDHWFSNDNWFEIINKLIDQNPQVDIWGNILMQEPLPGYKEYCGKVNLHDFVNYNNYKFLHGMTGLFSLNAINRLKKFKVPYIMSCEKDVAFLGERLFSNIVDYLNLIVQQFPDGVFNFFLHGDENYKNYLFSAANVAYHTHDFKKAKEYFYKYYEYCSKINFLQNMDSLFNNIACTHYQLGEKKEAKYIWKNLLDRIPHFPVPNEAKELINESRNIKDV